VKIVGKTGRQPGFSFFSKKQWKLDAGRARKFAQAKKGSTQNRVLPKLGVHKNG